MEGIMGNSAKTLLIVDDEAIVAMDEAQSLKKEGYAVIQASSGQEAIDIVRREAPAIDLILMDINLGKGMDGTQAAQEILKTHDIPVVFLSSHTEREIVEKTEKITSYGYVVKDTGITVLAASINMAFKLHTAYQELKKKEEALRESEERFRTIFDQSPIGAALTTTDFRFVRVNEKMRRMMGYSNEEFASLRFADITHPEHLSADIEQVQRLVAGEIDHYETDKRYIRKDKTVIWGHLSLRAMRDSIGNLLYFLPMVVDITERKQTDERMRVLFELMDIAPAAITIHDFQGNFLYTNQKTFELHGYSSKEEFFPINLKDLDVPESSRLIESRIKQLLQYGELSFEVGHFRKDGSVLPLHVITKVAEWSGEKVLLSVAVDITELKRAEEALRESESRFRTLVDSMEDVIFTLDAQQRHTGVYGRWLKKEGFAPGDFLGKTARDIFGQANAAMHESANRRALAGEYVIYDWSVESDSGVRHYQASLSPVYNAEKKVMGVVGIGREVTSQKQVEDALRRSQAFFNIIIEQSPYPMWISDEKGILIRINKSCCDLLDISAEEVIGRYDLLNDNIVEEQGLLPLVRKVFDKGEAVRFEITYDTSKLKQIELRKKSSVILDTTIVPIKDVHGRVTGAIIQHINITGRKQVQKALERSIAEKDILLKELQHRVKNNLNVISSLFGLEMDKLSDNQTIQVFINAQSRIRSMSAIYEQLYSSTSLDSVDLDIYIKELAVSLFETYAVDIGAVKLATSIVKIKLDIKRAVPLGLILNELIMNALKHAYPDNKKGTISVKLGSSDSTIELCVSDDGVGFPAGFNPDTAGSMGLRLVRMLANQIDGELSIESRGGIKASVRFTL
ncbi:MAG: hypothetical protein A2W19_00520 [Spirochaetes bacterium RBG_16_49_21]|nr:MAG: hypothetical protein A2W19_00520 [Spirochaetes bacterium RBG_16_49_21]